MMDSVISKKVYILEVECKPWHVGQSYCEHTDIDQHLKKLN